MLLLLLLLLRAVSQPDSSARW